MTSFQKPKPLIFSVDGNIGSGKSTLVSNIQSKFGTQICLLKEPVNEWEEIKENDGENIIQKFYKDQTKYAFHFQIMAYISRLSSLRKEIANNKNKIIICERSVLTDRHVFAKMLYDCKKMSNIEYQIYLKWFNEYIQDVPISGIIYLKTRPEIAFERINKRARKGEEGVPIEYLCSCHEYHETWLESTSIPVHTINGDIDIISSPNTLTNWIEKIDEFIKSTI